jgi:hypothetical protein
MVQTRKQVGIKLRTRTVNRRVHKQLLPATRKPWKAPAYGDWPAQEDGEAFVAFIRNSFERFKADPPAQWTDNCKASRDRCGRLKLLPHQRFIHSIVAPNTTVKRMLIAASTGSGKTMLVASIICNFLDESLYPTGARRRPSKILVVTQNAGLKEQLYDTLQNDAPCVLHQFKDHPEPTQGKMTSENHPFWWAEKWLKSHTIPVLVMTYGQAVRKGAAFLKDAVVVMDEVHTLVDTSALAAAQRNVVLQYKHMLDMATPQVVVGMTGSPLGQSWKDFVELHNVFAARGRKLSAAEFKLLFLDQVRMHEVAGEVKKCLGKDASNVIEAWNPKSPAAVDDLAHKVAPHMYFYDASFDATRYATARHTEEIVEPSETFIKHSLYKANHKLRDTFGRTRLVATSNIAKGTVHMVSNIHNIEMLQEASPVVAKLFEVLSARKKKAVVYSNVQAAYGSEFVFQMLQKLGPVLTPGLVMHLHGGLTTAQQSAVVKRFNAHAGVGRDSAILVLGPQFSTGIDLSGAAGSMHLLNVLPNDAIDIQARGRVQRSCSHRDLPKGDWNIQYHQYVSRFTDVDTGVPSCDIVAQEFRRLGDSVMAALRTILRDSSLGCKAMAKHHRHQETECRVGGSASRS